MEQQLLQLLADTQSPAPGSRRPAEARLAELYAADGFPRALAAIAVYDTVDPALRLVSLTVLRQFVLAAWSPTLDEFKGRVLIGDTDKAHLRSVLLELATGGIPDRRIVATASTVVSKIAAADFPDDWPDLLQVLLAQLVPTAADARLHGALRVLADLVDSGFSEEQFFSVARQLVAAVFEVAADVRRATSLRALAVAIFKSCFDTLEMVLDDHRDAIRQFLDQALRGWAPFFLASLKEPLPTPPSEDDEARKTPVADAWQGTVALKLQVVKTLMKIRIMFPALLTPLATTLFSTVWAELSTAVPIYEGLFIHDERQARLEDADNLPYTLDLLVLEELDFMQALLRAPPVKAELQGQLQAASAATAPWLQDVLRLVTAYAQISAEDEGLWDVDVNLFLSEETSITANYSPRSCAGDLVVKLGEWLHGFIIDALLTHVRTAFATPVDSDHDWKKREAILFVVNQELRDFADVDKNISLEQAHALHDLLQAALQGEPFLRARAYLIAGSVAKTSDANFHPLALDYLNAALKAVLADPDDVVQAASIRVLQDFLTSIPSAVTKPLQHQVISTLSDYLVAHDLRDMFDSDDLKLTLVDTLRTAIMVDPATVLDSPALDLLFQTASDGGAVNFQLSMVVTETFEDVVAYVADLLGPDAYARLAAKVLPSLLAAIDVGDLTEENALVALAADLLRALAEHGPSPLPSGFVASALPKLTRLLLHAEQDTVLPAATLAVRHMLAHDPAQTLAWTDQTSGKGAVETILVIIDHLLGVAIEDAAAAEVGGLAAELVEQAGASMLGPYLPRLLGAVAARLATAEQAAFIQSLILVFARLTLVSAADVVDFLAPLDVGGTPGLHVVLAKWLDNAATFAGYDEVRQNAAALTRLYALADPRLDAVTVKGDLIVDDLATAGRVKTRSMARANPDRHTIVPAPVKIVQLLVDELAAAAGAHRFDAGAANALAELDSDDGNDDEWEDDEGGGVSGGGDALDLGSGLTKQQLMALGADDDEALMGGGAGGGAREQDEDTYKFLRQFFAEAAPTSRFREVFAVLPREAQEKLRMYGS